jgi:hypothetical protein
MSAARKNAFMLSSATLMMAKYGDALSCFDLTPDIHSVGLAKEIAVVVDSSNIDLTAGVAQGLVDTQRTNVQSTISGSVQEYTAENLMRAQGIATGARPQPLRGKLTTEAAGGAVSLTIADNPIPGEAASSLGTAAGAIKEGDTLLIQHPTIDGLVFPARATAASTYAAPDHTVAIAAPFAIPTGMTFPVDSPVWVVSEMPVGSMDQTDLFSVKIVGTLSNFNRPVVYVAPKVQVTKGFNLSFTETQYGAMPWEMRGLMLAASEATGRLAEIGTKAAGRLYAA